MQPAALPAPSLLPLSPLQALLQCLPRQGLVTCRLFEAAGQLAQVGWSAGAPPLSLPALPFRLLLHVVPVVAMVGALLVALLLLLLLLLVLLVLRVLERIQFRGGATR